MELGQMIFGNSTGEYECPDYVKAFLTHLFGEIDRVFWNRYQRKWDRYENPNIPGISYAPYFWGDCDCGYEEREAEWSSRNEHGPDCYQTEYNALEGPRYALPKESVIALCEKHGIPYNDGVGSAVHCTCDFAERWAIWSSENDHSPLCSTMVPNFAFGSVEVRWYKYFPRGMTVNKKWPEWRWRKWFDSALERIREADVQI